MRKETLSQARRKAIKWKINALVLMFVLLLFCINSYLKTQAVQSKDITYDILLLEKEKLIREKIRSDSLISKQDKFIRAQKCD